MSDPLARQEEGQPDGSTLGRDPMTSTRKPDDLNQAFDSFVPPCERLGARMRFELEVEELVEEHPDDAEIIERIIAWRYKLGVRETSIYFASIRRRRPPQ